jgi:hypothetical protein
MGMAEKVGLIARGLKIFQQETGWAILTMKTLRTRIITYLNYR